MADPGFLQTGAADSRQNIIRPKFSQKLHENKTIGPREGGTLPCALQSTNAVLICNYVTHTRCIFLSYIFVKTMNKWKYSQPFLLFICEHSVQC